jgi:hypothetical protein
VTDDELDVWRRQWHSQPAVPIDLIRKVERQTVYMRLNWILQILPGLVGVGTIIFAFNMPTLPRILLAIGTWIFILIGWRFMIENLRGVWAPTAETTAAYVELSIERCRRKLKDFRFGNVLSVLLTAFVMIVLYQVLASAGALRTTEDYLTMVGSFLFAAAIVAVVLLRQSGKRKKTEEELAYLLNLQRQLKDRR